MSSGFTPENFSFLINSRHIDTDNNLAFRIIKFRRYRKLIVADRIILSENPIASKNVDTIHALEALDLALKSNPNMKVPEKFNDISNLYKTISGQENHLHQNQKGTMPKEGRTPVESKGRTPVEFKGRTPVDFKGRTPIDVEGRKPIDFEGRMPNASTSRTPQAKDTEPISRNKRSRSNGGSAIDRETAREEQRRSQRIKSLHRSYTTYITLENLHDQLAIRSYNNIFSLDNIHVPKSYEKAMQSSHSRQWKEAMDAELKGLKDSGCYIETQLPPGKRAIFSKWVLAVKTDSFGQLLKFKARCTARGDMLRDDEFEDVSSPVAGWTSIS